jgi:sialate O-acetylesterase
MRLFRPLLSLVLILALAQSAMAFLMLPSIIGDNMVLQQGEMVNVWGWSKPNESVKVTFDQKEYRAIANTEGRWTVKLNSMAADKTPKSMSIITGSGDSKTINNILVGEVWVCSGQSNMQWSVAMSNNAKEEIAAANYPELRLFQVKRVTAAKPLDDLEGQWVICTPDTVAGFSALGYFFGRDLQKQIKVPVGLINTSWGGTPSESWTKREWLERELVAAPLLKRWDEQVRKRKPGDKVSPHTPSYLYNAMIHPILPYSIAGAIWYQGESNVGRAVQYRTIFPLMIENWRADWGKKDLPFGFVQIGPFHYHNPRDKEKAGRSVEKCAELWEAQLATLKELDNTGMVVITDITNLNDIHPKNKQDVGARMALWATSQVYGGGQPYSGPIFEEINIEKNQDGSKKIRLFFDHAEGLKSSDDKPLSWFTIAGEDEKFVPATAKIEGDTIVVSSPEVKEPVAVRFGWNEEAMPNLTNGTGLPASPFRTDNFKLLTEGAN